LANTNIATSTHALQLPNTRNLYRWTDQYLWGMLHANNSQQVHGQQLTITGAPRSMQRLTDCR